MKNEMSFKLRFLFDGCSQSYNREEGIELIGMISFHPYIILEKKEKVSKKMLFWTKYLKTDNLRYIQTKNCKYWDVCRTAS